MDDMNAFERQLARDAVRDVGPIRPVDDLAIFNTIAATQSPKWRFQSMFSATKFVVAGAIVALFGGFLLSGVLTQPSDEQLPAVGASASAQAEPSGAATAEPESKPDTTTATSDLLPGVDLVTEEVEPGVYRVLSDGVRDLRWKPWGWPGTGRNAYSAVRGAIAVGPSGEVWSFTAPDELGEGCPSTPDGGSAPCTTFYRLGAPETHVMEEGIVSEIHAGMDAVDVAQDGTIWEADAAAHELRSFDGEAWTTRRQMPEGGYWLGQVVVGRDGEVWGLWRGSAGRTRLGRFAEGKWSTAVVPTAKSSHDTRLVAGAGGEAYIVNGATVRRVEDLDRWPVVARAETTDIDPAAHAGAAARAGGGMVWWVIRPDKASNDVVRFDGSQVERFDVVPDDHFLAVIGVGADGSGWLAGQFDQEGCDGIIRHDGAEARRFLAGTCPVAADFAPDGSVWLQAVAPSRDTVDLYVITPKAVAAAE